MAYFSSVVLHTVDILRLLLVSPWCVLSQFSLQPALPRDTVSTPVVMPILQITPKLRRTLWFSCACGCMRKSDEMFPGVCSLPSFSQEIEHIMLGGVRKPGSIFCLFVCFCYVGIFSVTLLKKEYCHSVKHTIIFNIELSTETDETKHQLAFKTNMNLLIVSYFI